MIQFVHALYEILSHPCNRHSPFKSLFVLIWWKINQVWFHWPAIVNITPEMKCICQPDSSFGSLVVYTKWPEYEEMRFVYERLKPAATFIDIGAGLGEFTLIAASHITKGKIIAFEPLPEVRRQLEENVRLNHLQAIVQIDSRVVADKNGKVVFQRSETTEQSGIAASRTKMKQQLTLSATTLDSLTTKHHLKSIDIVKIDTEGAELKILQGAKKTLRVGKIKHLLVELNPISEQKFGYTPWQSIELLHQCSYAVYQWQRGGWSLITQPGDLPKTTINVLATRQKLP